VLGGVIWSIGMGFNVIASTRAGAALSYGLGQGATMIGAIWGVFIWKEFEAAPPGTARLLAAMFAFYLLGLGILIASKEVVLTLGPRGALVVDDRGARLAAGFAVNAVDTTAAGDVFNGALAVALTEGRSLDDAVGFANAAAAISVTQWGAQPSAPTRRAIDRFLRNAR
jgi:sugar/nucleoside kinase (ribokinase family)